MLFKRLDILPNSVQIDDDILERPSYLSVSEWQNFWEACREGDTWQEGYDTGYRAALANAEEDHKAEIDHLESEHAREIAQLEDRLEGEYDAGFEAGRG